MALAAPVAPGAADPGVQDAPAVELHVAVAAGHQIGELGVRVSAGRISCATLNETGTTRARVVGQRRVGEQDQMGAAVEPPHDLGRGLLARELAEELLHVLNLQRALLEIVLGDVIFHDLTAYDEISDFRFKI